MSESLLNSKQYLDTCTSHRSILPMIILIFHWINEVKKHSEHDRFFPNILSRKICEHSPIISLSSLSFRLNPLTGLLVGCGEIVGGNGHSISA